MVEVGTRIVCGGGGGGREKLGTDSKGDSKIEHFKPYRPSLMDS